MMKLKVVATIPFGKEARQYLVLRAYPDGLFEQMSSHRTVLAAMIAARQLLKREGEL